VSLFDVVKRGAAALTDGLAVIGARMPGLSRVTITAGGATVTVTPKPPSPPPACPTCGAPHPPR
jgi:hypothetical protein